VAFSHVKKFLELAHTRGPAAHWRRSPARTSPTIQQWVLRTDLSPTHSGGMHRRAGPAVFGCSAERPPQPTGSPSTRNVCRQWHNAAAIHLAVMENATDRIPEEVISPLLGVGRCDGSTTSATTSLAAREEWWSLYPRPSRHGPACTLRRRTTPCNDLAKAAAPARRLSQGEPARLPSTGDGEVNAHFSCPATTHRIHVSSADRPGERWSRAGRGRARPRRRLLTYSRMCKDASTSAPWLPGFDYHPNA